MKNFILFGLITIVILSGITVPATKHNNLNVSMIKLHSNTFHVGGSGPENYTTIQDAIDDATTGDTVYVYNGTYDENLEIDKKITLIGENKHTTSINGKQQGCTITVSSEYSHIENFTILGGGFDTDEFINYFRAGIRVTGSHTTIRNNIFRNNRMGLSGVRVTNLTIQDNMFENDGIGFTCYENDGRPECKREYFVHTIENNTVNGQPFHYYLHQQDQVIENREMGQLLVVNCTNVTLKNITISNTDCGVTYAFCTQCTTEYCTIVNNSIGIWTLHSNKNIFQFNNISHDYDRAVVIDYHSSYNRFRSNHVASSFCGVEIEWWSNANLITKNNFINNNVSGYEHQSLFSMWFRNYYDHWRGLTNPLFFFFPQRIYGMPIEEIPTYVRVVSYDFFPAKQPYDIEMHWV